MTPEEFAKSVSEYPGVSVSKQELRGKEALVITRLHGDSILKAVLVNVPVRIPGSMLISNCRQLDIPLSGLAVTAHDL